MTDSLSSQRRSENMRQIKSKGMKPEMVVRRLAHSLGYRYRLHTQSLPGKPDLVFPRLKKIIDVRGCFWHQHGRCTDSHIPNSRKSYWAPKLESNVRRDTRNVRLLRRLGWRVLIIWECQTGRSRQTKLENKIARFLAG
ncbi:MAG: very short patch repair endonuclease [Candidatus Acidiferrales bacterium]